LFLEIFGNRERGMAVLDRRESWDVRLSELRSRYAAFMRCVARLSSGKKRERERLQLYCLGLLVR